MYKDKHTHTFYVSVDRHSEVSKGSVVILPPTLPRSFPCESEIVMIHIKILYWYIWRISIFIYICKSKGNTWTTPARWAYKTEWVEHETVEPTSFVYKDQGGVVPKDRLDSFRGLRVLGDSRPVPHQRFVHPKPRSSEVSDSRRGWRTIDTLKPVYLGRHGTTKVDISPDWPFLWKNVPRTLLTYL